MRRHFVPATAIAAVLLATALTGCSAQVSADDCTSPIQPGSLSDNVTVLGEFGDAPQVSVPSDVTIEMPQSTVVSASDDRGAPAGTESLVSVNIAYFDASTGAQLGEETPFNAERGSSFVILTPENESPLGQALTCSAPGDRTVIALSPMESLAYMDTYGLTPGESLIMVVDTVTASPLNAEGSSRGLPAGFPAVVTDETGQPGVVLPPTDAPQGIQSGTRISGDGPVITAEDSVVAQVLIVDWEGEMLVNTRDSGNPVPLGTEANAAESGVTFRAELTGYTVGSQIVIVEGGESAQVLVVDVLAAG